MTIKVKCIDNKCLEYVFTIGKIYEAEDRGPYWYIAICDDNNFYSALKNSFTVVYENINITVICINNTGYGDELSLNKEYCAIVNDISGPRSYGIIGDNGNKIYPYRTRFKIKDTSTQSAPIPAPSSIHLRTEAELRKMLRPRVEKHECICGIPRAACSYHRN